MNRKRPIIIGLAIGAALMATLMYNSEGEPLSPIYIGEFSATEREQAEHDYNFLVAHCPILFTDYMEDIDKIEIEASSMYMARTDTGEYGTSIEVQIKSDTKHIPVEYRAFGHTLRYLFLHDGIITQKDQSHLVCEWTPTMSFDGGPPVPGSDLLHPFASDQIAADCELEDYRIESMMPDGKAIIQGLTTIEGVTTCHTGRIMMHIYEGDGVGRRLLGKTSAFINEYSFLASLKVGIPDVSAVTMRYFIQSRPPM